MADKNDIQQTPEKINSQQYDKSGKNSSQHIDHNEGLDLFTKEVLRLFSPLQYRQERYATKDV